MLGFMLNYALRVNLTIAIVDMVVKNETDSKNVTLTGNLTLPLATNSSSNSSSLSTNGVEVAEERFPWDSYQRNFVLGCFFWGYILTELPGGRLAELIGGRRVFGHSMLWASLLTLITPLAAHINYVVLIVVRVVLGFMLGASWPAIHPVAAVWIPPMERSKFMSNMMGESPGLLSPNQLLILFLIYSFLVGCCHYHAHLRLSHLRCWLGQCLLLDGSRRSALVFGLVHLRLRDPSHPSAHQCRGAARDRGGNRHLHLQEASQSRALGPAALLPGCLGHHHLSRPSRFRILHGSQSAADFHVGDSAL